ncbi:MAG: hypothetical protein GW809_01395 [Bacteroidetes bacterium]|nr:hypothetical protein [Bacteroidota bacterium]
MQEYNNTDKQIHWLSQVITKVNKALVPEKEDDSHTNLYFDAIGKRLIGRWIDTSKGKIILTFNIFNNDFEWLDSRLQNLAAISVVNKELNLLEQQVSEYPSGLGLNVENISKPLHFEIPDYQIQTIQDGELTQEGLDHWCKIRELANVACFAATGYLQAKSEIRIWPHHFDTGIYCQVNKSLGIGFGLAIEDSMVGEPYFYLAGYRLGSTIKYDDLPHLSAGKWLTGEHWKGAVLPLGEFYDLSTDLTLEKIKNYIKQSADWFLKQ